MPNYIEKEWVLEAVKHTDDIYPYKVPEEYDTYGQYNEGWSDACDYIRGELETLTAADVEPVVHGKPVVKNRPKFYKKYEAVGWSVEGERLYIEHVVFEEKNRVEYCPVCAKRLCSRFNNYCPNCGAKMDLEE